MLRMFTIAWCSLKLWLQLTLTSFGCTFELVQSWSNRRQLWCCTCALSHCYIR